MLPVKESTVTVPFAGFLVTTTVEGTRDLSVLPAWSLLKVGKVTGVAIKVVAWSVLATGGFTTKGFKTLIVNNSVLQPEV